MRVDSEQLAQHVARGLAPLYTVVAGEPLLALEAADLLRARARAAGYSERTLLIAESGFDWGRLGAAGATLSLFAERRLIELRVPNGKPGVAGAEAIQRYAAAPAPDTVSLVMLPALDWKSQQAGWFEALDQAGVVVEARPVPRERLPKWLEARLAGNGQSADRGTLDFIAERVEGNLLAAWQEVQKLALLLPKGKLGAEDVRKAVLDVARFDTDDLSAALLRADRVQLVRVIDGLQAEGAALPFVLWTLANDLRSAHHVAASIARGQPAAAAVREARAFGPRRAWIERAAGFWSPGRLRHALTHAARIDRMVKGLEPGAPWDELRRLGMGLVQDAAGARARPRA